MSSMGSVGGAGQRDSDVLDLSRLFGTVLERRWWVICSVVFFTGICAALAFLSTPVYRASAVLVPATDRAGMTQSLSSALGQLGGLASLAGIGGMGGSAETDEALAVLRSREFTERFIDDWKLMPRLYEEQWDPITGTWKVEPEQQPTPGKAYKKFDRLRTVLEDKKASVITLRIDWTDREEAAKWANELVRRLNEVMRARAIARAEASVGFLENELRGTSVVATRDAISRLIEAQIRQRMLANVTQEYSFRFVDRAVPADKDDPVSPRKLLLLAAGMIFGFLVGVVLALVRSAYVREPART
jgi:uncharacterized protein involved in exopolysaccharide biosynthesis